LKNTTFYFFTLIIFSFLLSYLSKVLLNTDELVISSLADQLTTDQLNNALDFKEKWQWIGYLFIPIITLIKVSLIVLILDIGLLFFDELDEIKYNKLFEIVIKSEFIFLFVIIFKTGWFYFFQSDYTLEDLQYFHPLSSLNIIGYEGLETWFIYPFQVLNIFELIYWIVLSYLLGKELKANTDKGFQVVASSYGIGLLIWVGAVMFFTLNTS
jgi:hypothetical protein